MEYRDFSITIEPMREDGTYPVSVRSPAGEDSGVLKLDPSQIGALLTTAGRTRSSGAGTAQRDIQVEALPEEQPSEIGEKLFDALFSDVSSVYERSVGRVEVEKKGLRIKLHIDPTKPSLATLSSLPWELLYQKKNHRHLNLSKSTPVVRYLDLPIPYETVPFDPPLKILVVMANPDGSEALDLTKEREDIEKNWAKADNVEVEFLEKATVARLQDLLARQDYHVIHYMGHGDFDESSGKGVLLMHDETGGRALVTGKKLGMVTLNEALMALVQSGNVEASEAYSKAADRAEFAKLLSENNIRLEVPADDE